jgi:hypothetical protein
MNQKTRITIQILCIVILLTLNIFIYINGKNLKCENCIIQFESLDKQPSFNITLVDIVDKYNNDTCVVNYDKTGGFLIYDKKFR